MLLINVLHPKKEKYILFIFQNVTQIHEKQVILLMISSEEKRVAKSKRRWYYHSVKKLSALLREIISKNNGNFYCLNCLHSFRTKNKLELHKNVGGNKDFSKVIMPCEDTKILEFDQCQKSDKAPYIIYADLQFIIEKIHGLKIILKIHL